LNFCLLITIITHLFSNHSAITVYRATVIHLKADNNIVVPAITVKKATSANDLHKKTSKTIFYNFAVDLLAADN